MLVFSMLLALVLLMALCASDSTIITIYQFFVFLGPSVPSPSRLAIFENRVYWSDATKQGVMSVDKYEGPNTINSVYKERAIKDPKAIKILHPLAQPEATNPCGYNNGGCQQLCIVTAPTEGSAGALGFRCACSIGRKLATDRRSCDGKFH